MEILRQRTDRVGIFEDTIWKWYSEKMLKIRISEVVQLQG